jgi:predicted PurR-regulated permease PerM
MPPKLLGEDLKFIGFTVLVLAGLFLIYYLVRLIRELIPTVRQLRRTVKELERTIQNSQEIIYNLKSITRNIDQEVQEAHEILGVARGIVGQVETVTTAITRPVNGLRNLLMGVGYGMKYLLKRDRPEYEEEEV